MEKTRLIVFNTVPKVSHQEEMERAKTDTQVSACKPFPPKMVKQPTQPSPTDQQMDLTTD